MILNAWRIIELLRTRFPDIRLMEEEAKALNRYESQNSLLLEFTSTENSTCVLKFYSLQGFDSVDRQERERALVLKEVETIKSFNSHPNVIEVYHVDELWNINEFIGVYVIMEKLPYTLGSLINHYGRFTSKDVVYFLYQMDQVLTLAHYQLDKPVIHSDIKPSNIGVRTSSGRNGDYVLMDFDIAVSLERVDAVEGSSGLTNKGSLRGLTPAYASPEQIMSYLNHEADISNRVDIYAVGAIAMQMLTGVAPYSSSKSSFYHLPWDRLAPAWRNIFQHLCNPDPDKRSRRIRDAIDFSSFMESDSSTTSGGIKIKKLRTSGIKITPLKKNRSRNPNAGHAQGKGNQKSRSESMKQDSSSSNQGRDFSFRKEKKESAPSSGFGRGASDGAGIRPNHERSKQVTVIFFILVFIFIISFFSNLAEYRLISRGHNIMQLTEASYVRQMVISLFKMFALFLSGIFFILWFRRAYFNLHQLKIPWLKYSEGWAAGAWFVPVISLFYPYQIMRDIWAGTIKFSDPEKAQNFQLIGWWWALFIISGLFEIAPLYLGQSARTLSEFQQASFLNIVSDLVNLMALAIAIKVVKEVSEGEEALFKRLNPDNG